MYLNDQVQTTSRSQARILLQTFALRMAVATAYGHLGTMQGKSDKTSASILRMFKLLLFPGLVILQWAQQLSESLLNLMVQRLIGGVWHWQHAIMIALGIRVRITQTSPNTGSVSMPTYAARSLDPSCVELSWHAGEAEASGAHIYIGRALVQLAFLAQAVASLVLVVRRLDLPGAALILDWSNGLYAIIGICAAINSLGILALRGQTPQIRAGAEAIDPQGRVLLQQPSLAPASSWSRLGMSTMSLARSAMIQSFIARTWIKDSPMAGMESAPGLWQVWLVSIAVLAIYPLWREAKALGRRVRAIHTLFTGPGDEQGGNLPVDQTNPGQKSNTSLSFLILIKTIYYLCLSLFTAILTVWAAGEVVLVAATGAEHVLFYAALIREQILIGSSSMSTYAQAKSWQWADSWSERLFVY